MPPGVLRAERFGESGGPRLANFAARCLVLIATLGWASDRGPIEAQAAALDWTAWSTAIREHVPGRRDAALTSISTWSRGDLEGLVPVFSSELARAIPAEQHRLTARALLLHTDIAVLNRTSNGYSLPPTGAGTATTLFSDGTAVGQMVGTFHWEFMRRILGRLPASDDRRRMAQIYFHATAAELERWGEYPELGLQLAAGRKLLGDDPALLMYEGTMYQAYAGARTQRFFAERRRAQSQGRPIITVMSNPTIVGNNLISAPLNRGVDDALPAIKGLRQQAERTFRRALSLDPALAEARIRLAHIVGDDGRHEEAATELTRAMAAPLTPFLRYYAALVMGREQRALTQLDVARTSFEGAHAIYPDAAPPRYGLSEIALVRGDADRARALLLDLPLTPGDANWLWGRIDRIHDPSALSLLDQMRRAFSQ